MADPVSSDPRQSPAPRTVRLLEDGLIDQIAAGEVVERPASVVKELVENALDAGATQVRVEVRDGGITWIAVQDDGGGMSADDARMALQRHATSKILRLTDLESIHSFGFRGEALPAIASVSRLRLVSRVRGAPEGIELRVDGGKVVRDAVAGCPEGTRIEVADLFEQVPARRKFLKRPQTEWGHIYDWLLRSSLALPGVHFEVRRDDRPALVWPATGDLRDRIAAVLSEGEASALLHAEGEDSAGRLEAYVSGPEHTRANTQGLFLFVNGRPVRDPLLRSAVLQVYRDWLPRGRFPTALIFLEVPPGSVDVNVHPAKWEVRFADPRGVQQLVRRAIRRAVEQRRWLGAAPAARVSGSGAAGEGARLSDSESPVPGSDARSATAPRGDWHFAPGEPQVQAELPSITSEHPTSDGMQPLRFADLRCVGQLLASYLVVESKQGLLLVDQHAAHERVLYERLRAEWLERGVELQALLTPQSVELDPLAAAALVAARDRVLRLGFEIEEFGDASIVLRAVPALLAGQDPVSLVRELAEELQAEGIESGPESREPGDETASAGDVRLLRAMDRIFATLACHSARRFGDPLVAEEQRAILDGLDAIPWAPTCPHGRPVAVFLDRSDIERRFGRR